MKLHSFVNEISAIGIANKVTWTVGVAMFLTNVQHAGEDGFTPYPGAEVDYAALQPHLDELRGSAAEYMDGYRDFGKEIRALRAEGDYEGAKELMEDAAGE